MQQHFHVPTKLGSTQYVISFIERAIHLHPRVSWALWCQFNNPLNVV
jgi:hypothetical protein